MADYCNRFFATLQYLMLKFAKLLFAYELERRLRQFS